MGESERVTTKEESRRDTELLAVPMEEGAVPKVAGSC